MKQTGLSITVFALFLLLTASTLISGDIKDGAAGAFQPAVTLSADEMGSSTDLALASNSLLSFNIPQNEYVRLSVYNTSGREIAVLINDYKKAGEFSAELKQAGLVKGTYYYRLVVGRYKEVRRLEITK